MFEIGTVQMKVRKLLKVFGRKHAVLPGPAGRDLPKRGGELRFPKANQESDDASSEPEIPRK